MTNDLLPDEIYIRHADGYVKEAGVYEVLTFATEEDNVTSYIRADLVSTLTRYAEVDLDGLRGDVYAEVSRYCVGTISPVDAGLGAKIAFDYLATNGHLATGKGVK